jgi:hypothetical protein
VCPNHKRVSGIVPRQIDDETEEDLLPPFAAVGENE